MANKQTETVVGLVVVLAILIFAFGMMWLSQSKIGKASYDLKVVFEEGGGLRVGDPVTIAGIQKGKIKKIKLVEDKVLAILEIDADVKLKEDARVMILDLNMMGDKRVAVSLGQSEKPLNLNEPVKGTFLPGFSESLVKIGSLTEEANETVKLLRKNLVNEEITTEIKEGLKDLRTFTKELQEITKRNKKDLEIIVSNFKETSITLNKMVGPNRKNIESAIEHLSSVSARLDSITAQIQKGEGTVGQLMKDKELYEEIKKTTKDIDELVKDIKTNPKKYINVGIF
ncbi:MAG: MlaD family protein [Candidatus Edwardsbacteria bacterium]